MERRCDDGVGEEKEDGGWQAGRMAELLDCLQEDNVWVSVGVGEEFGACWNWGLKSSGVWLHKKNREKNIDEDHAGTHKYKTVSTHRETYTEVRRDIFTQIQSDKKKITQTYAHALYVQKRSERKLTSKSLIYASIDKKPRSQTMSYIQGFIKRGKIVVYSHTYTKMADKR